MSEAAVAEANQIVPGCCQVIDVDCQPLPVEPRSLDMVMILGVLQHLQRPGRLISDMWRVLHPGGIAVVFVPLQPSDGTLWQTLKIKRDMEHINSHSKSTWISVFELNGFQYIGNLNRLMRLKYGVEPTTFWLGRKLERYGPFGRYLWKQLVPYVEGSLLFRSLEWHPSVAPLLQVKH